MVEFEVSPESIILPIDLLLFVDLWSPFKVINTKYGCTLISTSGMIWEELVKER
jgi:hypothetical protein